MITPKLLLAGALVLGVFGADHLGNAAVPEPGLTVVAAPGDSMRVVARWQASTATGITYSTRWLIERPGFPLNKSGRTGLADTTPRFTSPPGGDSVLVTFAVWTVRTWSGTASADTQRLARYFKRADVPPAGPGPITLDTSTVALADSVGVYLSATNLVIGDTAVACALARAGGQWYLGTAALIVPVKVDSLLARIDPVPVPAADAQATGLCTFALAGRTIVGFKLATWPALFVTLGSHDQLDLTQSRAATY